MNASSVHQGQSISAHSTHILKLDK